MSEQRKDASKSKEEDDLASLSFDESTVSLTMVMAEPGRSENQSPSTSYFPGMNMLSCGNITKENCSIEDERFLEETLIDVASQLANSLKISRLIQFSYCKICNSRVDMDSDLIKSLTSSQVVICGHPTTGVYSDEIFVCLVCDCIIGSRMNMEPHMKKHLKRKEIYYCSNCQAGISKRRVSMFPENALEVTPITIENFYKRHEQKVITKVDNRKNIPHCGSCMKPIGYLVPLLRRMVVREVEGDQDGSKCCFYRCCLCGYQDVALSQVETHFFEHIQRRELKCGICKVSSEDTESPMEGDEGISDNDTTDYKDYDEEMMEMLQGLESNVNANDSNSNQTNIKPKNMVE